MVDQARVAVTVRGRVQGVNFRYFVERHAGRLGLTGYVKNLPDGLQVEVVAEGERKNLEELVELLKGGPPRAKVNHADVNWSEHSGRFAGFGVRF